MVPYYVRMCDWNFENLPSTKVRYVAKIVLSTYLKHIAIQPGTVQLSLNLKTHMCNYYTAQYSFGNPCKIVCLCTKD